MTREYQIAAQVQIAVQAEALAKSIWNDRNICDYTELDTFLALTTPTIEAALTAAAAPPEGMVMAIREAVTALEKAEKQFTFYAENHTAAGKTEKAATNYGFAVLCGHAFERLKLLAAAEAPHRKSCNCPAKPGEDCPLTAEECTKRRRRGDEKI